MGLKPHVFKGFATKPNRHSKVVEGEKVCVFCGQEVTNDAGLCTGCREYKGVEEAWTCPCGSKNGVLSEPDKCPSCGKPRFTKSELERRRRLLPNGLPKKIRVYDNGGVLVPKGTIDRYTVVFTGNYRYLTGGETWVLGMNEAPYSPQGFCQHCPMSKSPDYPRYGHLGKKIRFSDLPWTCQVAVLSDYLYLWSLAGEEEAKTRASEFVQKREASREAVPV